MGVIFCLRYICHILFREQYFCVFLVLKTSQYAKSSVYHYFTKSGREAYQITSSNACFVNLLNLFDFSGILLCTL